LPLYRKITNGQFCSAAHRKAYWVEQERLAVERLHQTHDSLHAYRPQGNVESILGKVEPEPSPVEIVEFQPVVEERPAWLPAVNAGDVPVAGFCSTFSASYPALSANHLAGADPQPLGYSRPIHTPLAKYAISDCGFEFAEAVHLLSAAPAAATCTNESAPMPLPVVVHPVTTLTLVSTPVTPELEPMEEEELPPLADRLFAIGAPSPVACAPAALEVAPAASSMRVQLPLDAVRLDTTLAPAALLHAGLTQIPIDGIHVAAAPSSDPLRAFEFQGQAPKFDLAIPPMRPRLRLAAGRRYPVQGREAVPSIAIVDTANLASKLPSVALPERDARVMRAAQPEPPAMQEPAPANLVALEFAAELADSTLPAHPAPAALSLPQPPRVEAMRPKLKLEPIEADPAVEIPVVEQAPELAKQHVWMHAVDFWNRAPLDMKILVFAIPVLLGLALHPSLPKVRTAAPAAANGIQKNFSNAMNQQLGTFRQTMVSRAAIALDEDFRSGLDEWVSKGEATTQWSFDSTGFVRPGPLAMYRPTMGLTDYQMQFLGMLDKQSLSFVVRAADFDNYYVVKLVVLKPGPVPSIGVIRYAVINGKAESRGDAVVPIDARADMLYRVRIDVHGDDFALSVQGQMVDSWSEPRLNHGGVGFFAAPGEESRLRWVQVTHQYDMLGRLCAYLAPYNVASANGNW
jgi:hypothetical protein